jgi:transposase InsO family protein
MGMTIQFESHKVELPFIYELEHDNDVLEFYDQPPSFNLSYQAANGRSLGHPYTPDFFVIRTDSAGWVECKTEQELQKLAEKNPNRYKQAEDGKWCMPPGEKYAKELGLFFQVWEDTQLNWILHRNLQFLEGYYRSLSYQVKETIVAVIISIATQKPGISLTELINSAEEVSRDDINFMILQEKIYIDLATFLLSDPEHCRVFKDRQTAHAYQLLISSQLTDDTYISQAINIERGTSVVWDSRVLTIDLVGKTEILLHTESKEPVELSIATFQALIKQGKISGLRYQSNSSLSKEAMEVFLGASEKDIEKANNRLQLIQPFLDVPAPDSVPHARNIRILKSKYQLAEKKYGYGYLGLLSLDCMKGNRNRKLPDHVLVLMEKFIKDEYEQYKQKTKLDVYSEFVTFCSSDGIPLPDIPTYKTFRLEIKKRSGYDQIYKRKGKRAAYSLKPFHMFLTTSTPPHGERPFHICHIDHTPLDIELRDSGTGKNLGKPWATFLVDAFSRRILSNYLTFDPPSYRSCMMVLRICVKKNGYLPQTVVVDNGKEFHSNYFRGLAGLFEFTLKYRPPAEARFNTVGERLFGTTMTQLIYSMAGNTQITKEVRQMTKSNNPKNLALWTLGLLYLYLNKWVDNVYELTEHPALGRTPREAFIAGVEQYGKLSHKLISYDENFKFLTLPTTNRGKAKVNRRLGVRINYFDYWSDAFRDPQIENKSIDVRYEPFDTSIAYAKANQRWVECKALIPTLKGRSEKEIQIASQELRKRYQEHGKNFKLDARQIGEFLLSVKAEELLLEQQLRDRQLKEVFTVVDGGFPNLTPYTDSDWQENTSTLKPSSSMSDPQPKANSSVDRSKLIHFKKY